MNYYNDYEDNSRYSDSAMEKKAFITRTYLWMTFALALSGISAWMAAHSHSFIRMIFGNGRIGMIALFGIELFLVISLSARIRKISTTAAKIMFTAYAIVNGLTLSTIFFLYSLGTISNCFFATAGMFLAMSVYGAKTKNDLTTAGHYLKMALMGIVIASLVNFGVHIFTGFAFSSFDWIISIVTVVVFVGLTAYDTQKILMIAENADSSEDYKKVAIIGALELYLDFINIFLRLLRLFGRSRN